MQAEGADGKPVTTEFPAALGTAMTGGTGMPLQYGPLIRRVNHTETNCRSSGPCIWLSHILSWRRLKTRIRLKHANFPAAFGLAAEFQFRSAAMGLVG